MHTKDIEYAISMVAHPKAQTIRAKALAQLNSLLNRIVELEAAQHSVQSTLLTDLKNNCVPVNGVHAPFCTGHESQSD